MIPNIIYAVKVKDQKNLCKNKFMNVLEQIGRYGSMFLMVFNIGLDKFAFGSVLVFTIYLIGSIVIILAYWVSWILYFRKKTLSRALALAILPTGLFILCGLTLRHYLLLVTAVIFGVGHGKIMNRSKNVVMQMWR